MSAPKYIDGDFAQKMTGILIDDEILSAAEDMVERETHLVWESTAITNERHSGNGTEWLQVQNYPLLTFVSASIYDEDGALETSIAAADITEMQRYIGKLKYEDGWTDGFDNILINYTWGYESTPQVVKVAVARIAALLLANPIASKDERLSGYSATYGTFDDILKYVPRRVMI